jgi:hypothetical protein
MHVCMHGMYVCMYVCMNECVQMYVCIHEQSGFRVADLVKYEVDEPFRCMIASHRRRIAFYSHSS